MGTGKSRCYDVLLVEDNEADVFLMQEVLRDSELAPTLHVTMDGKEAMDFLQRKGAFSDAPRPDLILLDLNLPKMDGRQVLKEIKESGELKIIPVVVLTTSESDEDIRRSYDLHANCYVTKPVGLDQLLRVVGTIETFWFATATLPTKG